MLFSAHQEKNCSRFLPTPALLELALCCQRSPRTPGPPRHSIQFISSCGCSGHSLPGPRALRPPPGLAGLWLGAGTSLAARAAASPASASSLTGLVGHSVGCLSFPCSHVLPSLSGPVCAGCWHWGHGHSGIRPRGGRGGLLLGRVQLGRLWPSLLVRGRQGRLTPRPGCQQWLLGGGREGLWGGQVTVRGQQLLTAAPALVWAAAQLHLPSPDKSRRRGSSRVFGSR